MSNFWESDLGAVSGTSKDAFTKTFKQIPDGTMALAKISKYFIDEYENCKFFKIDWIITGGEFKGQHVFQKLKAIDAHPRDKDPARTRHRALNMMKLLYNLFDMKPSSIGMPDDAELGRFHDKPAGIKVRETEPHQDTGKQYNWVSEIHPAQGFMCETGVNVSVTPDYKSEIPASASRVDTAFSRNPKAQTPVMEDDIPF